MHETPIIPRRPVNYNSESLSSKKPVEYRPLRIYVGDMVQVINPNSHLMGKFGLVEDIQPRNPQFQVIVKIGKIKNPLKFRDLKFCTRINKNDIKDNSHEDFKEEDIDVDKVNQYIDQINRNDRKEEIDGNREGANEKHGVKL